MNLKQKKEDLCRKITAILKGGIVDVLSANDSDCQIRTSMYLGQLTEKIKLINVYIGRIEEELKKSVASVKDGNKLNPRPGTSDK